MGSQLEDIERKNREIEEKYGQIIEGLKGYEDAVTLCEGLLNQLHKAFGIPYVWISLITDETPSGLIRTLSASEALQDRLNLIEAETFRELLPDQTAPVLANDGLKPFFKLMPPRSKFFVKSIAVAPLTLNGQIIGSLNHGDFSPYRYHPEMETSLLARLAIAVSNRLGELAGSSP